MPTGHRVESGKAPGFAGVRVGVRGPSFQAIQPLTPATLSPRRRIEREDDFQKKSRDDRKIAQLKTLISRNVIPG